MKTIVVDMDGVLCHERKTFERSLASPIDGARAAMHGLRQSGHVIIIHTARSWSEYQMTREWLWDNDIPYDELVMGKPVADIVIDDRAVRFSDWASALEGLL